MKNEISPKVNIKTFSELTPEEVYEILRARFSVFVSEQRCFYLDPDGIDYESLHFFIQDGREITAYARLFKEETPRCLHLGRMLTRRRRQGLGRKIMEAAIERAKQTGATCLRLEAQTHATGFYERFGLTVCSEEFEEAGMPHVKMELHL